MSSTFGPSALVSAVRTAVRNPDLGVRVVKSGEGYTVTMPCRHSAQYLNVAPDTMHLGWAAQHLTRAIGFPVWVSEVRYLRRAGTGPLVRFDVTLAR